MASNRSVFYFAERFAPCGKSGKPAANRFKWVALLCLTAMHTPDGMGADRYRERQNMREATREPRRPLWEVVAVDDEGNILYGTEFATSEKEAQNIVARCNPDDADDDVAEFKAVRTNRDD